MTDFVCSEIKRALTKLSEEDQTSLNYQTLMSVLATLNDFGGTLDDLVLATSYEAPPSCPAVVQFPVTDSVTAFEPDPTPDPLGIKEEAPVHEEKVLEPEPVAEATETATQEAVAETAEPEAPVDEAPKYKLIDVRKALLAARSKDQNIVSAILAKYADVDERTGIRTIDKIPPERYPDVIAELEAT